MLKKSVLVVALLLIATNLWAVSGPMDVSAGRHNLTWDAPRLNPSNEPYLASATSEDEVCIFCHTPHGGTLNTPLWNRALPVASTVFTHYTSTTLSDYMTGAGMATREVKPESILCMSCHDGSAAMNSIVNNSNRTGAAPDNSTAKVTGFGPYPGPQIGGIMDPAGGFTPYIDSTNNLSDDHPISFSYSASFTSKGGGLQTLAAAKAAGLRFFGPDTGAGNFVECSSCHDPHVNYEAGFGGDAAYSPFLVTPNTGSALCLGCHIK